jgi:hypothetical protein
MVCLPRACRHRPPERRGGAARSGRSCCFIGLPPPRRANRVTVASAWHEKPARVTGQPLSVAACTGAHPSRETGSRRGEPESPQTSCSGKERRSEQESARNAAPHVPPSRRRRDLHTSGGSACSAAAADPGRNSGLLAGGESNRMAARRRDNSVPYARSNESSLGPKVVRGDEEGAAYSGRPRSRRGRSIEREVVCDAVHSKRVARCSYRAT